jgi:hypothetical protein
VHDDFPLGRAQAPPPYAAALFQETFKNRKLIRHLRSLIGQSDLVSFDLVAGLRFAAKYSKNCMEELLVVLPQAFAQRALEVRSIFQGINLILKTTGCSFSPDEPPPFGF